MLGEVNPKELCCTAFIPSLPTVIQEIVQLNPTFSVCRELSSKSAFWYPAAGGVISNI